mmetsp:Transcript_8119/g.13684  ORF Transcript_8119/g.13684 Transcript_8119/m.13684 type:complete len:87 (+) Transcript_8119:158-418(+)|eukprot:CAMPEP_0171599898 /NCGR_PEP_ID=MMETSP0990-20121206/4007_1 /TAXON_ID=483369 /ORGANISM="non described non described, Strain CCMP2098" /LENGTH=86 /DNA_ID=CAMNT_0012161763 /DNA_START=80 /DNA_END=340 /DNA_ORIENTATION=-
MKHKALPRRQDAGAIWGREYTDFMVKEYEFEQANHPFGKARPVTTDFMNMRPSQHFPNTISDALWASKASTSGYSARGGMQRTIAG